ncbi:tyrosine-type recombinase/integrase [Microbacterium oryzae]|uniref:tyrosine-type recombinase/integrase n=1 Tax=Microbacterium oryzae TaxID=743009 RepID=UPI0025AF1FF2|nr:tyrosine-type recombinase/integrase [Microbacterium oryzae]
MANATAHTPARNDIAALARDAYLARYDGATRQLYAADLRVYFTWCAAAGVDPMAARRPHLELFIQHLLEDRGNKPSSVIRRMKPVRGFYQLAVADELIDRDPTVLLRLPKVHEDPEAIATLTPEQVKTLLRVAIDTSPAHAALVGLMSMLGLRVSEACAVRVEDFREDDLGYVVLRTVRKGGKIRVKPIPVPLLRIIQRAAGDRTSGPLILTRAGKQQTRAGAYDWTKRLLRKADLPENAHPHTLRHAAVTAVIDAGATLIEAQEFADHADPRTTLHYYRNRGNLDQHAAHLAARAFAVSS